MRLIACQIDFILLIGKMALKDVQKEFANQIGGTTVPPVPPVTATVTQ
jgi:hypothetical protein